MIAFLILILVVIVGFILMVGYLGLVLLFAVIGFFAKKSEQSDKDV